MPNELNLDSIYETSDHLKQLGIKQVSLLRLVPQGRAESNRSTLIINNEALLGEIIQKYEKKFVMIRLI